MKKEIERRRTIPAFSVNVAELDVLWHRAMDLFDTPEDLYSSLTIKLPTENLEFKDVEELRAYPDLKGQISSFSFHLSERGGSKSLSLRASGDFVLNDSRATVYARSESEAWCAGAVETVYSFLQSYKTWHQWLHVAPLGILLILLVNIPLIYASMLPKDSTVSKATVFSWLVSVVAIGVLYFYRGRLFRPAVLVITNNGSFIRNYSAEISLVLALVSIIVSAVGLFMK